MIATFLCGLLAGAALVLLLRWCRAWQRAASQLPVTATSQSPPASVEPAKAQPVRLPDGPAWLLATDHAGTVLAANSAWCRGLARDASEVVGHSLAELLARDSQSVVERLLREARSAAPECAGEVQLADGHGQDRELAVSVCPEDPASGTNQRLLWSFFDLSALRRAERSLAFRESRFRGLVEDQDDMVSLATTDGVLTFVNQVYARHFGLSPQAMLGRNLYEFIAEADRAAVRRYLRGVMEGGRTGGGQNRMIGAQGKEIWVAWINRMLPDSDGRMSVLHSVGRNITERIQAERAMQLLSQEQTAILNSDLIGIAKVRERKFLWLNRGLARILGYEASELAGVSTEQLHFDRDAYESLGHSAYPLIRAGQTFRGEIQVRHSSGARLWLETSAVMFDAGRDESLWVYTDVTASKRAEMALRESLAMEARQRGQLSVYRDAAEAEAELARFLLQKLSRQEQLDKPGVAFHWRPAETFSGDLIAVAASSTGDLYGMLADATGHGLAAAINLIPLSSAFYAMAGKGFNLITISEQLNLIVKEYSLADRFVAVTLARFIVRERRLEVANAGNPAALLLASDGRVLHQFGSGSVPFGILDRRSFKPHVEGLALQGDEQLLLYSDGVIEAGNPAGEAFGRTRLDAVLLASGARAVSARMQEIRHALEAHAEGAAQQDDISLLLLGMPAAAADAPAPAVSELHDSPPESRADWSLHLRLSVQELRRIEIVPVIVDLARTLGLEGAAAARFFTILSELFVNALEHGLLELDSRIKEHEDGFRRYQALREARLQALSAGQIEVALSHSVRGELARVLVVVEDSGEGFDHREAMRELMAEGQEASAQLNSGRGLPLLHALCDRLVFEGNGNRAMAEFSYR